jgi:hypothetical protein
MMKSKQRTYLIIFLVFIFLLLGFILKVQEHMRDFEVNYTAGKRLMTGETLYQRGDGHYIFKYLPSSALFYLPLSLLPLWLAKALWFYLVAFSIFCLVYISYKLIPEGEGRPKYLLVLTPLILAKFILRELQLGQINAVVGMVLLFMAWLIISEGEEKLWQKEVGAGALWGLALALKPHSLIFLPYFIVKKNWRALSSGLGVLIFSFLVTSLFYGFRQYLTVFKDWASQLSRTTPYLFTSQDNISVMALFMKWTGNRSLSYVLGGVVIILLAFLVLAVVLKGRGVVRAPVLECSILLILIPLVSPLGWDYTLLVSVLGVMLILQNFFRYPRLWRGVLVVNFFIIAFSLFDIMGRELYAKFMSWSVITFNFLILIAYLSFLRFKKVC